MKETRDASNTITITPQAGGHSATVIFCHGLGDSADGWIDTIREFSKAMPWIKFIVPTAPTRPISLNGGMPMPAWFDIASLSPADADRMAGVDTTVTYLDGLIEAEVAAGLTYDRILLGGFSQGAAMSLYAGLSRPADKKIGGIIAFSGFMPNPSSFSVSGSENVPVFQTHGDKDPVVNHQWGKLTHELLKSKGCTNLDFTTLKGIPHSVNNECIRDAAIFCGKMLPDDASKNIPAKDPATMSVKELRAAVAEKGLQKQALGFSEKGEFVALLKSVM
jgi:predicted esterase